MQRSFSDMKNFWKKLQPPIIALSPMAGVTDAAFRVMCKRFGADVIYTEFASANALVHGNKATRDMIAFVPEERPVVCQIFGSDPKMMGHAATILEEIGFDGVDINFGCPAYKVVKHGGGVCLMRNPKQVAEITQAVCEGATTIPVSLKLRGSIKSEDKQSIVYARDIVQAIKGLPVSTIMVHGRSFEKPFDGEPNCETIRDVVGLFPGIVLANGGIHSPEDAKKIIDATGAAGIGVARGAWGHPWIFKQIKEYLSTGSYTHITREESTKYIIEHAERALATKGTHGIIELRKHLARYVRGFDGASALRAILVHATTLDEVKAALQ